MIRRFNYTGRQRIDQSRIAIAVGEGSPAEFEAQLDLTDLNLPGDARVFVEGYRGKSAFMRFDYGTVDNPTPPQDRRLVAIPESRRALFRVKVVVTGMHPVRLLAVADRVRPSFASEGEAGSRTILDPVFDDLGDLIWKVDFQYANEPVLMVNENIFNPKFTVASDRSFAGLVFPSALREILEHILAIGGFDDDDEDDQGSWVPNWLRFVEILGVGAPEPDWEPDDIRHNFIDPAVAALATKISAAAEYSAALRKASQR